MDPLQEAELTALFQEFSERLQQPPPEPAHQTSPHQLQALVCLMPPAVKKLFVQPRRCTLLEARIAAKR